MATNVHPDELNYDHYAMEKYDDDIVRSIPGHEEMHLRIDDIVRDEYSGKGPQILELGIGTGLTARRILNIVPGSPYTGIDFSENMLQGARERLAPYNPNLICADYAIMDLPQDNDIVVSVIGIHHQETDADKKRLFRKIYDALRAPGLFLFGDLVTFRSPEVAALNEARHYHHLVENARDEASLKEWAHHHKYLNRLAALEDQVQWLREASFNAVDTVYTKFNTALIAARK